MKVVDPTSVSEILTLPKLLVDWQNTECILRKHNHKKWWQPIFWSTYRCHWWRPSTLWPNCNHFSENIEKIDKLTIFAFLTVSVEVCMGLKLMDVMIVNKLEIHKPVTVTVTSIQTFGTSSKSRQIRKWHWRHQPDSNSPSVTYAWYTTVGALRQQDGIWVASNKSILILLG